MKRLLRTGGFFRVPDGTWVAPLFNPLDTLSALPGCLDAGFSVAVGRIGSRCRSAIHLMPHVAQLTLVLEGSLRVRMKGPHDSRPYTLRLGRWQAVLTRPGTFVQLANDGARACRVLYIVSPSYVFEWRARRLHYDDAVAVPGDWAALARRGWDPGAPLPTRQARARAAARTRQKPR